MGATAIGAGTGCAAFGSSVLLSASLVVAGAGFLVAALNRAQKSA